MAILKITEYAEIATDANGNVIQAGLEPALAVQAITYTTASVASAAFNARTKFVRMDTDTRGFIVFAEIPVAVAADDSPLEANTPEFFGVRNNASGTGIKVAIIT